MNQHILTSIDQASKVLGKTWPLYSFVASNPLSGYEDHSFLEALKSVETLFNTNAFPAATLFRQAWENKLIDKEIISEILRENGFSESPEESLQLIESQGESEQLNAEHKVDRMMAKWLSAFMDEGLAEWEMPYKSDGFYEAWRHLVIYDVEMGTTRLREVPKTSAEALSSILEKYSEQDYVRIFSHHLAALPGWTGYINHRIESNSEWQQQYPISFMDYLAVRLFSAEKLRVPVLPATVPKDNGNAIQKLKYNWLQAWEQTWQHQLVKSLETASKKNSSSKQTSLPDAQLVFCIDTRSEGIRRHVEASGDYETYGYAGFFGIAMDYKNSNDGITRKSCPPIVQSAYTVTETAQENKQEKFLQYIHRKRQAHFVNYFLKRMKNMLPSTFGYVEGSGFFYGLSLVARTLLPASLYKMKQQNTSSMETMSQPDIHRNDQMADVPAGISLEEKVAIVKGAFDLMGWKQFAPTIVFVGHGSHSANNPFSSSLDCGACAASPGRHNARMLAKLANLPEVRKVLAEAHQIHIPAETVFIGAEHNTTTESITLFDSEIPASHHEFVSKLYVNLLKAQKTATREKLGLKSKSLKLAEQKANDWSETRPEWGLANNTGFVVGPRQLTQQTNLKGRCFLHSYDWELDTTGKALEGIMQGPMVVTQWINNHYYFSTVDNQGYGGGSKITHNITGKFGVVQGNGGDLKMGLPLQSLYRTDDVMQHQPLRLTVVIQAPTERVSTIVSKNKNIQNLLDNEWIYLMVIDPTKNNEILRYANSMQWKPADNKKTTKGQELKTKALEMI